MMSLSCGWRSATGAKAADECVEDGVGVGSRRLGVGGAGDVERSAVEAAEGDVGEGVDGDPGKEGLDQRREDRAQHGQLGVLGVLDAALPHVLGQHRHAVEHHDRAELGLEAGVEEGAQTGTDSRPRLRSAEGGGHHPGCDVGLDGVVDGAEEGVFAREVVVEGTPGHARPPDDLLDRGRAIATLGEELTGDRDEELAGRLRLTLPQLDGHALQRTD